jgi:hypothetical protein
MDHLTYQNFKYIDIEKDVNINIPGTFPEYSGNETYTLTNNTN